MEPTRPQGLVSAVVVARNEAATLRICLTAVRRALDALGGGDILLVDSASSDSTARVGTASGCRVITVRKAARICPSAMRRLGASRTESRYILFLDGDCELESEFLPAALQAMEADPLLGVVAGRRRDFYRTGQALLPASAEYYGDHGALRAGLLPTYGGCALYRRRALDEAGSFDPFLRAKEEEDLAQRITAAGYRIEVIPVPMIRHMTVPRESFRRLLRSLRHGFYLGRGQAARIFLSRGEVRAAFRGTDRVLFTLAHLTLGILCLWAARRGIGWPMMAWLGLSTAVFAVFVARTRSLSRVIFYCFEWLVQGVCLLLGFASPRRAARSFWWKGEEWPAATSGLDCLPKVLLAGPFPTPPHSGGVEKGVALLLQSDLARRTSMRLFNTYRAQDSTRPLLSRLSYQLGMIRRFRRELTTEPLDVVHVKTSSGINFHQNALYTLVARLSGVPVILQIHSGRFEIFYRESIFPLRVWIRSALVRSRLVAVLSHSWAERVASIAPRSRIRVVPNGLDGDEVAALCSGGEIRPSHVFFLGTGRDELNREKGLDDLLVVLPDLARRHPQSRWILAGLRDVDATHARLRPALTDPSGQERLVCLGRVDALRKWELLKTSAILVLPSYFENMPNILLEAMAAGMGVVASDVGAIPEMLGYGEGGLLVPPGDRAALSSALDRLLSSPALVRAQGKRNRQIVLRDYSMAIVERRLEDLYLEAAGWPVTGEQTHASPDAALAT